VVRVTGSIAAREELGQLKDVMIDAARKQGSNDSLGPKLDTLTQAVGRRPPATWDQARRVGQGDLPAAARGGGAKLDALREAVLKLGRRSASPPRPRWI